MMLAGMNYGHNKMALWCIDECIRPSGEEDILDIGCGGGQNIANFLTRTKGKVCQQKTLRIGEIRCHL